MFLGTEVYRGCCITEDKQAVLRLQDPIFIKLSSVAITVVQALSSISILILSSRIFASTQCVLNPASTYVRTLFLFAVTAHILLNNFDQLDLQ
jgi:hypothetical protein